ncbi:MAG: hypothetical protein LUC43_05590, partial [Burkholderiales bacterium]|nr:hypothetical protein [Burkholderiales bacterium]
MKKTLLAIAILSLNYGWIVPAQASFYPIEVEKTCKAVDETDNRDERLQCLEGQISYLKTLLQNTYELALDLSKNQR